MNKLPGEVKEILEILNKKHKAYLVGGCLRDMLMGKIPKDYDLATSANPDEIKECLKDFKLKDIGVSLGTILVVNGNFTLDVTPFRLEGKYIKNRKPSKVFFTKNLEEDLKRRDFTMNAMAFYDEIIDLYGGIDDIKNKVIRTVLDPKDRICEDALRILRAIRFASTLNFSLSQDLKEAIKENANLLKNISSERIRDEFSKILMSDYPKVGLNLLKELNIYEIFLPEIMKTIDYDQRTRYHSKTLFDHLLEVVNNCPKDLEIRMAALLHDIEKPQVFSLDEEGQGHFYGHEDLSAKSAEKILKRLNFSKDFIKNVSLLIKYHMTAHEVMTDRALRRQIRNLGSENSLKLYDLMIADRISTKKDRRADFLIDRKERERGLLKQDTAKEKFLKIDGSDLKKLGFKEGPIIGEILKALEEKVLDDPKINTKENLIEIVERNKKWEDFSERTE